MVVFRFHAVDAQARESRGPLRIVRDHHTGIAIGAEVLTGIKAETADGAQRPGAFALVFGSERLGSVLDDR